MHQVSRKELSPSARQSPTEHCVVDGLDTRYLHRGGPLHERGRDSAPILILHGWGASIETVIPIVGALEPLGEVFALDLPGFGQTQLPPEPWGVKEYQRFVTSFMDAHGIERASLVGHSNGGRIAIRMAATAPSRVHKLVLVDSAGIRPKRGFTYHRKVATAKVGKHAARLFGAPGEGLRTWLVGKAASADYAAAGELRPTLVKLVNEDLRSLLPEIQASTLLIWGSNDTDTPLADARLMERQIPDAGLVELEGAGHYSYLDQPGRFGTIARHFLGGPDAA
jgi:pimeloyl-ACP methyl ester carboxylesterase